MENDATTVAIIEKIEHYAPSPSAIELVQNTPILLLVGISGAGKDSTRRELVKTQHYHSVVSHTTRRPRRNGTTQEQDGVDYHFITREAALAMLQDGAFIEAKQYVGNVYGTSEGELKAASKEGRIALADIEVQGVAEYKALSESALAVYLLPPSFEAWVERLRARYADSTVDRADILRRMQTAVRELEHALQTDYFVFVVNDNLSETVQIIDKLARKEVIATSNDEEKALARELLLRIQNAVDSYS